MVQDKIRQLLNLFFALTQPLIAALVNLGITGPSIGTISDRYPTYVVPAGYAFMIWNVIFALSLGYGIWQALPAQRSHPLLQRIGWLTASALAATSVWMLIFQRSLFVLSGVVMLWLLASLIGVVARLYAHPTALTQSERWLIYVHFSIFLGWITVATVANIGQILTATGWTGWGVSASIWGVVAVVTAGIIGAVVTSKLLGNLPYALTLIWALVAIAVNQFSGTIATHSPVVGTATLGSILLVGIAWLISRRHVASAHQGPWETRTPI